MLRAASARRRARDRDPGDLERDRRARPQPLADRRGDRGALGRRRRRCSRRSPPLRRLTPRLRARGSGPRPRAPPSPCPCRRRGSEGRRRSRGRRRRARSGRSAPRSWVGSSETQPRSASQTSTQACDASSRSRSRGVEEVAADVAGGDPVQPADADHHVGEVLADAVPCRERLVGERPDVGRAGLVLHPAADGGHHACGRLERGSVASTVAASSAIGAFERHVAARAERDPSDRAATAPPRRRRTPRASRPRCAP